MQICTRHLFNCGRYQYLLRLLPFAFPSLVPLTLARGQLRFLKDRDCVPRVGCRVDPEECYDSIASLRHSTDGRTHPSPVRCADPCSWRWLSRAEIVVNSAGIVTRRSRLMTARAAARCRDRPPPAPLAANRVRPGSGKPTHFPVSNPNPRSGFDPASRSPAGCADTNTG